MARQKIHSTGNNPVIIPSYPNEFWTAGDYKSHCQKRSVYVTKDMKGLLGRIELLPDGRLIRIWYWSGGLEWEMVV